MASFFFDKNHWRMGAYKAPFSTFLGNNARNAALIVREILRSKSGRRTEHLIAINVNSVPMSGHGFFFVWRHDCRSPGR